MGYSESLLEMLSGRRVYDLRFQLFYRDDIAAKEKPEEAQRLFGRVLLFLRRLLIERLAEI